LKSDFEGIVRMGNRTSREEIQVRYNIDGDNLLG
jgi:hypothetical protein